jgi:hypothetical protein
LITVCLASVAVIGSRMDPGVSTQGLMHWVGGITLVSLAFRQRGSR